MIRYGHYFSLELTPPLVLGPGEQIVAECDPDPELVGLCVVTSNSVRFWQVGLKVENGVYEAKVGSWNGDGSPLSVPPRWNNPQFLADNAVTREYVEAQNKR